MKGKTSKIVLFGKRRLKETIRADGMYALYIVQTKFFEEEKSLKCYYETWDTRCQSRY